MVKSINFALYRASIWFKVLDTVINVERLIREPALVEAKKVACDAVYLYGMYFGTNYYSMVRCGTEIVHHIQVGKYHKALEVTVGTINAMALPYILLRANRPYIGLAYGVMVVFSTVHDAIIDAYSFAQEITNSDSTLRSKIAYKGLAEGLATSSLQALYDFKADLMEYELQIKVLLFEKEKLTIKVKLQEQGEFGQKLFDYIYLPAIAKKYGLLNDPVRGMLTKAEASKFEPLAITYGSHYYDHCIEAEPTLVSEEGVEHYYCYSVERQVIDHIAIVGSNNFEVLERL